MQHQSTVRQSGLAFQNLSAPAAAQRPSPVEAILRTRFHQVIEQSDMRLAAEGLRDIAAEHGLGVAMMASHLHGLMQGHIPLARDAQQQPLLEQARKLMDAESPYIFVNVPSRAIRQDTEKLMKLGIMNPRPNSTGFVYHEDGLVGTATFDTKEMSTIAGRKIRHGDVIKILQFLEIQDVLRSANLHSMQVHFKDTRAKHFIDKLNEPVFVRGLTAVEQLMLEAEFDSPKMRQYIVNRLKFKQQCNYCSCRELNPLELTLESSEFNDARRESADARTARNYMFGFTFAPFGDPRQVMHFLAWDFPHINHVINSMDPQSYSFSDLIKLVKRLNDDMRIFCEKEGVPFRPVSGVCNHWAGNSLYHQHYQFFHIPEIPLLTASVRDEVTNYCGVSVARMEWEMPTYRIKLGPQAAIGDLLFVADKVALEWGKLNGAERDYSYGNGIEISNHTQNIFVAYENGQPTAYFIPRLRTHLSTRGPDNVIQKGNAAVLEMLGYFLVDNPGDMDLLRGVVPKQWFSEVLKGQSLSSAQVVESLQRSGYLDSERRVCSARLSDEPLSLDLQIPEQQLAAVQRMLSLVTVDAKGRESLAQRWLRELSPGAEKIIQFESRLKLFLKEAVVASERAIHIAGDHQSVEARRHDLMEQAIKIIRDETLSADQTQHLLLMINATYQEKLDNQRSPLLTEDQLGAIIEKKAMSQNKSA